MNVIWAFERAIQVLRVPGCAVLGRSWVRLAKLCKKQTRK